MCSRVCVCVCVLALLLGSPERRAFPFRIVKVQRAIPRGAPTFIHSRGTSPRPVRIIRSDGRTDGRPAEKNVRETHTEERVYRVLFLFPLFCPLPRKLTREPCSKRFSRRFRKGAIFLSPGRASAIIARRILRRSRIPPRYASILPRTGG